MEQYNIKISGDILNKVREDLSKGYENAIRVGLLYGSVSGSDVMIEGVVVPAQISISYESTLSGVDKTEALLQIVKMDKKLVGIALYDINFSGMIDTLTRRSIQSFMQGGDIPYIALVVNSGNEYSFTSDRVYSVSDDQ